MSMLLLSHFCCGVLFGGLIGLSGIQMNLALTLAAASSFFYPRFQKKGWCLTLWLLGSSWGYAHHAPKPSSNIQDTVVVKAPLGGEGLLQVENSQGVRFLVKGKAERGEIGNIVCRGSKGRTRCRFVANLIQRDFWAHEWLARRLARFEHPVFGWLWGIMAGRRDMMERPLKEAFKESGLVHLLVVSGLHLTLVGGMLSSILMVPARILLGLKIVSPGYWSGLSKASTLLVTALLCWYMFFVGCGVSVQRALLIHVVARVISLKWGEMPSINRICLALFLQMILFPVGFVHLSTLLTWGTYLVVSQANAGHHSFKANLTSNVIIQIEICILVSGYIGLFSPWWPVWSLLVTFTFPALLLTGAFSVFLPGGEVLGFIGQFHGLFLDAIVHLGLISGTAQPLAGPSRFAVLLIGCIVLLRILAVHLGQKSKSL